MFTVIALYSDGAPVIISVDTMEQAYAAREYYLATPNCYQVRIKGLPTVVYATDVADTELVVADKDFDLDLSDTGTLVQDLINATK